VGKSWPGLAAFAPVHAHKSRHECVLQPFEILIRALDQVEPDRRQLSDHSFGWSGGNQRGAS
jgi:hypothetical protein